MADESQRPIIIKRIKKGGMPTTVVRGRLRMLTL